MRRGKRCSGEEGKLYPKPAASVRGASKWRYSVQETSIALGLGAAPLMRTSRRRANTIQAIPEYVVTFQTSTIEGTSP